MSLVSCNHSLPLWEGWGGVCYLSFFRNNLRRFLLHHFADVEGDYNEDYYGSDADAQHYGHYGGYEMMGNLLRYSPVFQELVEEDNCRDGNYAGHTYEPQVKATEEQGYIPSLGAVNLA